MKYVGILLSIGEKKSMNHIKEELKLYFFKVQSNTS